MSNRVLHLVHSHQRRGAEVFAAQLATVLEARGCFENGFCSLYRGHDDGLPLGDLPQFKLQGVKGSAGIPRTLLKLRRVMTKFQPEIVVAHGGDTLKYAAGAGIFYRRARLMYRNIGTASFWAKSPVKSNLNRVFLRQFDSLVSVSQYTRDDFQRVYGLPPDRVAMIPNGVDTAAFDLGERDLVRSEVRRELEIPPDAMVLISVGNLSTEKGHGGLLGVFSGLARDHQDLHLLLVGDGPLRPELEAQARGSGAPNRVHFLGRRSDVPRLLMAADLFVLPSNSEGMPAVLIEAGLAGLPSVAFDVGGVAEVVEHGICGLLVKPADFEGLSRSVSSLSRDLQLRRCLGEAAEERCRELFGMDRVAQGYEQLFLSMLRHYTSSSNECGKAQEGNVADKRAGSGRC